jgi:hypothetical protein
MEWERNNETKMLKKGKISLVEKGEKEENSTGTIR